MPKEISADICVVGGGSGGLMVAAGASQMGAEVVLLEGGKMGGDCLNYGCVPSKSLLAAAHTAYMVRSAGRFGITSVGTSIDFKRVHDHVHNVISTIAPNDSVHRFEALGVRVIQDFGRFIGPTRLQAGNTIINAKRVVISTGSSPNIPSIPGINDVPYLTNRTIFDKDTAPDHLIVIGGGSVGCEIGQAYCRLGCKVTLLEKLSLLGEDDPELSDIVRNQMISEGLVIREKVEVTRVDRIPGGVSVTVKKNAKKEQFIGSDLLVAAGRLPNLDRLDLEAAGVKYDKIGVTVDMRLRTTNKKVFAIGDAIGSLQFTHVASYHAGIVIRNALFKLPAKVNYSAIPWVTYTAPELAHVGMTESNARQTHGDIRILRHPFSQNDRAHAEHETNGFVKVITTGTGLIVGASIVGSHAGELIQSWILPIQKKMKIKALAGIVLPYPTLGEVSKRAAGSFYTPKLFSDKTKKLVRLLQRF
ncbi:MAG: FAD-dependent oxidoreductase [Pseudomonadota bacterium]|nr:FAD-dependent oxidoreductase [Pseudomonadota bacterium]